jgi:hypothetical protein
MKLNSCKIDLKFKLKSQNSKIEEKRIKHEKNRRRAYLAAARLAGLTSQPTEVQLGIPIQYATGKQDPPKEIIVFHLWINRSSSVSPAPPSLTLRFAPPPSSAYKTSPAAI